MVPEAPLEVSLVIPTFNQRTRTIHTAQEAERWLQARLGAGGEIIVVDDGSTAAPVLDAGDLPPGVQFLRHPKKLDPLPTTLAWLRDGADVVIGDRLHPESDAAVEVGALRKLSSIVYTWLVRHALGLDFADTQCGYKGYRADIARALYGALEVTSFAFDAELLLRAKRAGYQIRRQPVRLVHDKESSVSLLRHAPAMLWDVARLAWWRYRRAL